MMDTIKEPTGYLLSGSYTALLTGAIYAFDGAFKSMVAEVIKDRAFTDEEAGMTTATLKILQELHVLCDSHLTNKPGRPLTLTEDSIYTAIATLDLIIKTMGAGFIAIEGPDADEFASTAKGLHLYLSQLHGDIESLTDEDEKLLEQLDKAANDTGL